MKDRNTGIDLLRVISMLFIVLLHTLVHGGILPGVAMQSANYEIAWFLEIIACCGVNCFVLISGFVNVKKEVRYSNLVYLWVQVFFYSFLITLLFYFFEEDMTAKNIVNSLFPVATEQYWFFTSYFGLYLFMPVLNEVVLKTEKKKLLTTLGIILIFFTTVPCAKDSLYGLNNGFSVLWFIVLYLIGGYISCSELTIKISKRTAIICLAASCGITWLSQTLIGLFSIQMKTFMGRTILNNYLSPTILCNSICLLVLFQKVKVGGFIQKIVKLLTPLIFSVYLIHDNCYFKKYVISERFAYIAESSPFIFTISIFGIVILIFAACIAIDIPRNWLFSKLKIKEKIREIEKTMRKENCREQIHT